MYIVFFRGQKILGHAMIGLDNQPLFGKGVLAPPPKARESRPDTRERYGNRVYAMFGFL